MVLKVDKCQFIDVYQKEVLKIHFKIKTQNISFNMINNIIKKYKLDPSLLLKKMNYLIKKFLKDLKGSLKLLNIGEPEKQLI